MAQRVLRDYAQSEEVAQEVMCEVWATADRYRRERASVRGWVTRIAQRRAVDRLRRHSAQARREQRVADASQPLAHDSVVDCVERLLEHEDVRRGLEGLTELQSEAIHMVFFAGCGHAEAAARLGVPLSTAKTRIRDGLKRLRQELDR